MVNLLGKSFYLYLDSVIGVGAVPNPILHKIQIPRTRKRL